jgi:hypothetical protein
MNTSTNGSALTPSDSVRVVQNEDGAVLLDIRQGLCLSMTPVGVKIWDCLRLNYSVSQIAEALAAEFNVPNKQVHDDVVAFISDLAQKGLLLSGEPTEMKAQLSWVLGLILRGHRTLQSLSFRRAKATRFLIWKALIALLAFDLLHFGDSFPRMHEFVRGWTTAQWPASPDSIERVCHAVNWACVWYPKRVLCLQRSAVTTCLLRSYGIEARMAMGAQTVPFRAHAWTEVEGHAINERRNVQKIYMVWARC